MATRCRLSPEAVKIWPHFKDREGEFLGPVRGNEDTVRVRWDGNRTVTQYHHTFIEVENQAADADGDQR